MRPDISGAVAANPYRTLQLHQRRKPSSTLPSYPFHRPPIPHTPTNNYPHLPSQERHLVIFSLFFLSLLHFGSSNQEVRKGKESDKKKKKKRPLLEQMLLLLREDVQQEERIARRECPRHLLLDETERAGLFLILFLFLSRKKKGQEERIRILTFTHFFYSFFMTSF